MTLRTRLLVIAVIGLAALAVGMAVVWKRSQPYREFDKEAYLEEMALRGKSLDEKPDEQEGTPSATDKTPAGERDSMASIPPDGTRAPVKPGTGKEPIGDQPKIVLALADDTFDLGTVPNDKPTKKMMPVRNEGKAPLEISQVTSSCGCTKAKLDDKDKTVPPGGSVDVELTVNPKAIHGFDSTKLVTIISNDPDNRLLKVKVHARVEPEFELTPETLDFGSLKKGDVKEVTMRLRQAGEEPIELTSIEMARASAGELAVSFDPVPEADWETPGRPEYVLKAKLDTEAAPVGAYTSYFSLVTTCKRVPRFRCIASGHVESFFTVSPRAVPVYTARAGRGEAALIKVVGKEPITVEDLEVTGGLMTATAAPGDGPNFVQVRLNVNEDAKPGRVEERLSFTVKSETETARHSLRVYGNLVDRTARRRAHDVKIRHSGRPSTGVVVRPKAKPERPTPPASQ